MLEHYFGAVRVVEVDPKENVDAAGVPLSTREFPNDSYWCAQDT